jgi:hypothetical protein
MQPYCMQLKEVMNRVSRRLATASLLLRGKLTGCQKPESGTQQDNINAAQHQPALHAHASAHFTLLAGAPHVCSQHLAGCYKSQSHDTARRQTAVA